MQCRAPHYTTRVRSVVSVGKVNATGCRTQTVMNQRLKQHVLHTRGTAPHLCSGRSYMHMYIGSLSSGPTFIFLQVSTFTIQLLDQESPTTSCILLVNLIATYVSVSTPSQFTCTCTQWLYTYTPHLYVHVHTHTLHSILKMVEAVHVPMHTTNTTTCC